MTNILQKIADDLLENKNHKIDINNELDFSKFSSNISLFEYQQEALKNIVVILDLYFSDKIKLKNYYLQKGFDEVKYKKENLELKRLLNRASFWMATGSGKSIVMIKLIEILYEMSVKRYIDQNDILILAPTDKILFQVQKHIDEFNKHSNFTLELNSLKDYDKIKNEKNLFTTDSINLFYYRSDLIDNASNVSKKTDGKRLNYENYLNKGKWYIILDEAHKGKDEQSTKKNYYNEMAENGFIFNFSATFVDSIDKLSTVYNFNLSKFNEAGYGKNIKVVDEEFDGFNKSKIKEEFNPNDKKDIILKSCILFSAQKKQYEKLKEIDESLYHNPLMITVANTVNIKNADLKLYFLSLLEIAKEKPSNLDNLKEELSFKLDNNSSYVFGEEHINNTLIKTIEDITYKDILKYVFNSDKQGTIECKKTSLKDELLFKIKTSSNAQYFAMLKISEVKNWSNGILYGYDISEDVDNTSYFDNINNKDSTINILMGSKIFSEGWDSNRPNIVNFLNIGSANAKKYVMQTVGRGVRVEPIPNERKRIQSISFDKLNKFTNTQDILLDYANALESLFIFATSKKDIDSIFKELPDNKDEKFELLHGVHKNSNINMTLFIPSYKQRKAKKDVKYNINIDEYNDVKDFINKSSLNTILMNMIDKNNSLNLANNTISKFIDSDKNKYFHFRYDEKSIISEIDLINKVDKFFSAKLDCLDMFTELCDEIKHYNKIKVNIRKVNQQEQENIKLLIANKKNPEELEEQIDLLFDNGKISKDEYKKRLKQLGAFEDKKTNLLDIVHLKKHYYSPILMKDKNINTFFRNIISEPSEIEFINNLEIYLKNDNNKLNNYDAWYFSKIQENIDDIFIPYIDNSTSKVAKFYPDFIFWLKKDNINRIMFIDPKGLNFIHNTRDKIIGFNDLFKSEKFMIKYPNYLVDLCLYNNSTRPYGNDIDIFVKYAFDDIF